MNPQLLVGPPLASAGEAFGGHPEDELPRNVGYDLAKSFENNRSNGPVPRSSGRAGSSCIDSAGPPMVTTESRFSGDLFTGDLFTGECSCRQALA